MGKKKKKGKNFKFFKKWASALLEIKHTPTHADLQKNF